MRSKMQDLMIIQDADDYHDNSDFGDDEDVYDNSFQCLPKSSDEVKSVIDRIQTSSDLNKKAAGMPFTYTVLGAPSLSTDVPR